MELIDLQSIEWNKYFTFKNIGLAVVRLTNDTFTILRNEKKKKRIITKNNELPLLDLIHLLIFTTFINLHFNTFTKNIK